MVTWAKTDDWRYQGPKIDMALKYVKQWRTAVDIGAHCGLWSRELVRYFKKVVAFEPLAQHIECFEMNVPSATLYEVALGDRDGTVGMHERDDNTGASYIVSKEGNYPLRMLDEYKLQNVDFIKIDVEGYEDNVIRGAETTLIGNRPVLIVEQKPKGLQRMGKEGTPAIRLLTSMGFECMESMHDDYVFVPRDA